MGNFPCGVERVKRFVKVHLHCIVRNLKKDRRNVDVAPPGKISADAHVSTNDFYYPSETVSRYSLRVLSFFHFCEASSGQVCIWNQLLFEVNISIFLMLLQHISNSYLNHWWTFLFWPLQVRKNLLHQGKMCCECMWWRSAHMHTD